MSKKQKPVPGTPVQAILQPDCQTPKTRIPIPDEEHVKEAKRYVQENQK